MPEFMIDVCRIGNECLAVVLVSGLILSALWLARRNAGWRSWALFGALLGAGLLTKAYVLAFIPLLIVVALIRVMRACGVRRTIAGLILGLTLATAMAGWWYVITWQATGTLSGEQIDVEPGSWIYRDESVGMDPQVYGLRTGMFGGSGNLVFNRFTGPGRVGPYLPGVYGGFERRSHRRSTRVVAGIGQPKSRRCPWQLGRHPKTIPRAGCACPA